jgi:hypothetical protein
VDRVPCREWTIPTKPEEVNPVTPYVETEAERAAADRALRFAEKLDQPEIVDAARDDGGEPAVAIAFVFGACADRGIGVPQALFTQVQEAYAGRTDVNARAVHDVLRETPVAAAA